MASLGKLEKVPLPRHFMPICADIVEIYNICGLNDSLQTVEFLHLKPKIYDRQCLSSSRVNN